MSWHTHLAIALLAFVVALVPPLDWLSGLNFFLSGANVMCAVYAFGGRPA